MSAIVVGAGVSGLACAWGLARKRDVTLFEASERAGGVVDTLAVEGFRFETGPNTIPASAATFRRLSAELGIADRLQVSRPEAKRRYLFHRGRLHPLPSGPGSFLASDLLSLGAKLRLLSEPLRRHRRVDPSSTEPTLEAFLGERIGREATRRLAGAFVRGVYAAEIEDLGARSAFPSLWALANDHGGLLRGMLARRRSRKPADPLPGPDCAHSDLLSFPEGLCELPRALARALGPRLRTATPVTAIARTGGRWRVELEGGGQAEGDELVLAVPAPTAAKLLTPHLPPELVRDALGTLAHATITQVHLGLRPRQAGGARALPEGFGFLVPPDEEPGPSTPLVLGSLFVSNIFPGRAPSESHAVTSFYRTGDVEELSETELVRRALCDLELAVAAPGAFEPVVTRTRAWSEVIPHYGVDHSLRLARLQRAVSESCPGLFLAGNYTGGVSVEQCLAHGLEVAAGMPVAVVGDSV